MKYMPRNTNFKRLLEKNIGFFFTITLELNMIEPVKNFWTKYIIYRDVYKIRGPSNIEKVRAGARVIASPAMPPAGQGYKPITIEPYVAFLMKFGKLTVHFRN